MKKPKEDGPLLSAKFYGATPPSALLKSGIHNERPTLKQAFNQESSAAKGSSTLIKQPSKQTGKKCTSQFGCANIAVYTESSGTLYCRDHKPKQISVTKIKPAESKQTARRKNG